MTREEQRKQRARVPQNNEGERLLRLWLTLIEPVRGLILRGMVMSALAAACSFVPYAVAAYIGQAALRQQLPDMTTLVGLAVLALVAATADRMLFGGGTGVCHRADADFRVNTRHILLDHFAKLPLGWFSEHGSSEVKQSVSDDVLSMHQTVGHAPTEVVRAVLLPLIPLVYLFFCDWRMSLVLVAYVLLFVAASTAFMFRDYQTLSGRYNAANVELSSAVVEMAEGIEVVKAFGSSKQAGGRFKQAVEVLTEVTFEWTKLTAGPFSMLSALIAPGTVMAFLCLTSCSFIALGWTSFAECVPFLMLGPSVPSGFVTLASSMNFLRTATSALEHVQSVLDAEPLPEAQDPEALGSKALGVDLDDVTFSYAKGAAPALSHVAMRMEPGTVCALVGDSGSGKTTLARLVPRFWDPAKGTVAMGGHDLSRVATKDLLSKVAIVFQESMLLSLSIRDNIKLACPNATDEQVVEAARAAQIHERICEFAQGYDSIVGSADCNLSGGEAQRVAIARAILQDAPVLVLDEATAHADPENETAIQAALSHLSHGRTTLVIAHRLNTIAGADKICVLEDGRLIEEGTHEQLLAANGRYSKLWEAQQVNPSTRKSGAHVEGRQEADHDRQ